MEQESIRTHLKRYGRLALLLGIAAILALAANAPSLTKTVIDNSGFSGDVKALGDINGDGFADIAWGGYQMAWFEYPSWTKHIIASANNEFTTDMQMADIDNDGDLDLVTADGNGSNNVIWLENPRPNGSPNNSWTRHVIGTQGDWGHDIEVGDLDRDGKLDVVVRKTNTNLFFQNSPTSWTKRDISGSFSGWEGVALGDVDKDGDLDLAAAGFWVESPANPRTGSWTSHAVASNFPPDTSAAIGDINGDSRPDILFAPQHARGKLAWYEGPADPKTGSWIEHVIDNNMGGHKLNIGDLNGDGKPEVIAGLELAELSVYEQLPTNPPTFSKQRLSTTGIHNQRIADIGNDGDLDIVGANYIGYPNLELWTNRLFDSADTTPPSAVTNLVGTANSATAASLTWNAATDNTAVTHYNVYRCSTDACTPTTQIADVTSGTSYPDTTVVASTTYQYRVRAYDAAGNSGGYSNTATVTTPATPGPAISSFTAAPTSIQQGQSSTLSWATTGATSLTLNPGGIDVTGTTSRAVSPTTTTTYTLVATNGTSSTNKTATVTVTSSPVISSFAAAPTSIQQGQSSTLSWAATGATSLTLNPGGIDVTGTTSRAVSPTATTTYTLVATNATGSTNRTSTVTVTAAPNISVAVTPASIALSASQTHRFTATVTGTTNTAVTWSISPSVGTISGTGLYRAPATISTQQTVIVTARSNADTTKSGSATVTLNVPAPTVSSLTASPTSVFTGQASTLSWATTGATNLTLNPGAINVTGTTSRVVTPGSTTSYTLTATNSTSSASRSVSVTVSGVQVVSIAVQPGSASLSAAQTQQFTATVTGASDTSATWSINPSVGTISTSGLYRAPDSVPSNQTVTVTARSNADTTKTATATVTLNAVVTPPPPPPGGLLGYWPFDEGQGSTTADASGTGNNGTINGAAWSTAGRSGNALDFNGSTSYVNAGNFDVGGTQITLSAWMKADSFPTNIDSRIISKATGTAEQDHFFMLSVVNGADKRLRLRLKTGGTTKTLIASSATLSTNAWIHVVATYDGTTARLYQNGVQVGSMAMTGTIATSATTPVWIGSNPVGGNPFDGLLDEVRVYNRALAAEEVQSLFGSGH